jgi:trk system potassium uptake protein TrkH
VSESTPRRASERVIRRRIQPTHVIDIPAPRKRRPPPTSFFHARLFVAAFAVVVLSGAGLLALPWTTRDGEATPVVDALFTAVSAASVTGLVVFDTADHWNWFGQLIILCLIQAGGLGFMVGASLVLRVLRGGSQGRLSDALLMHEGMSTLTIRETIELSRRIVRFTFITEGIGALLLTARFLQDESIGQALWMGVFTAVSGFCNAGFDLHGQFDSMANYDDSILVNAVLIGLVQAGALSYIVLSEVASRRSWERLSANAKLVLVMNAALLLIGVATFLAAEWQGALSDTPVWARPMAALFQSVSARTAGFATVSFAEITPFTSFVWVALMGVGGASGSTSGGAKLATIGVIVVAVLSTLRGHSEPEVFNRRLPLRLVMLAIAVASLFFVAHFTTTLLLAATEHIWGVGPPFASLLFEAMSALATVGLTYGITPELSTPGKLVLIAAMFFGRIGPLTAAYALQLRQERKRYRLAETTVHIG